MSHIPRLIDNAARYASTFAYPELQAEPGLHLAVVACMDSRIDVFALLGLEHGDAHIIRNAGGSVTWDTLRSLIISQRFLQTKEIILIHHTGCGMVRFTDEEFAQRMEKETGQRPPWPAGAFRDPADDVRASISAIKDSPFILHKTDIAGFVFDVKTGALHRVDMEL